MPLLPALTAAALLLPAPPASAQLVPEVESTVFTHGEGGFPCIRIPSTLALPFDTMLSFAAARSGAANPGGPGGPTGPLRTPLRAPWILSR